MRFLTNSRGASTATGSDKTAWALGRGFKTSAKPSCEDLTSNRLLKLSLVKIGARGPDSHGIFTLLEDRNTERAVEIPVCSTCVCGMYCTVSLEEALLSCWYPPRSWPLSCTARLAPGSDPKGGVDGLPTLSAGSWPAAHRLRNPLRSMWCWKSPNK